MRFTPHPAPPFRLTPPEELELLDLTRSLIRIPSSQEDGKEIYEFTRGYMQSHGLKVRAGTSEDLRIEYPDLTNLYTQIGNRKGPRIMLNCHLDTVSPRGSWLHPPYDAFEEEDRIFGLGAADMKGGCAVALYTIRKMAEAFREINGTLFLSCVFGEEAPFSLGADSLLREYDLRGYDLIIVTEPSPLLAIHDYCLDHRKIHGSEFPVMIVGAEGRELYEIEFFGRSAHASHPSQGINALHDASRVITELARFDTYANIKMGRGHYCVINVQGGDASFTVPGYCKITVNRQLTLGETERGVIKEIRTIIRNLNLRSRVVVRKRFSPSPRLEYRPYLFEDSDAIETFRRSIHDYRKLTMGAPSSAPGSTSPGPTATNLPCRFTTSSVGDFNLFGTRTAVPTVIFGPGGANIHSPNEYVLKRDIIETCNYLLHFLRGVYSDTVEP